MCFQSWGGGNGAAALCFGNVFCCCCCGGLSWRNVDLSCARGQAFCLGIYLMVAAPRLSFLLRSILCSFRRRISGRGEYSTVQYTTTVSCLSLFSLIRCFLWMNECCTHRRLCPEKDANICETVHTEDIVTVIMSLVIVRRPPSSDDLPLSVIVCCHHTFAGQVGWVPRLVMSILVRQESGDVL